MKEISKEQVIDLMNRINVDGVDNTQYDIHVFVSPSKPENLQPGAYCALWVDDTDCSNMPSVGKWINSALKPDNVQVMSVRGSDMWIVLICLDLL